MNCERIKVLRIAFAVVICLSAVTVYAQNERQIPAPDEGQYGRRFFVQLRAVFGRFRNTDLQRAFDSAQPIPCSELVNDKGEWRTVAFFNEKRELGDWYRSSLEEVKSDLSVFTFKGTCRTERGSAQLTTRFPLTDSVEAFNRGIIPLTEVNVNVNAAVSATFDLGTQAYTFDLPYLYLVDRQGNEKVYSLDPPGVEDKYTTDVTNHWDCKSVNAEAVTYQFLICRTGTVPRNSRGNQGQTSTFGSSAYFILSDGTEASSSVKLSFGGADDAKHAVEDASGSAPSDANVAEAPAAWELPDSDERVVDLLRNDFRIRFNPQTWADAVGSPEVLAGQRLMSLESSKTTAGADYCVWLPGTGDLANLLLADNPEESVAYTIAPHDQDRDTVTSIVFEMRTRTGSHLGTLQCSFPRTPSAGSIDFSRWTSVVGKNLTIELR